MKRNLLLILIAFIAFGWQVNAQFTEDFEGGIPGSMTQSYVTGTIDWTDCGGSTGGAGDACPYSGGSSAHFYEGSNSGNQTSLETSTMDLSAGGYQLLFSHVQADWAGDQNTLLVEISTDGGTSWSTIVDYTIDISSWVDEVIALDSYTTTATTVIKFTGTIGYGRAIGLDDVIVELAPSCANPTASISNIMDVSADASWSAAAGAANYDWEVVPMGNAQGTGVVTSGNTAALMTSISGLSASTDYDFFISSDCWATWATAVSFTTMVAAPIEDVCSGAIDITVAAGSCGAMTVGNNTGATDSDIDTPMPPAATCNNYAGGDIWFKLTVPASGFVTISGAASPDCCSYLWYELYEGADCSNLVSFDCSATTGNDPSTFEKVLSGRTAGETIWIRAWDSSNDNGPGDFNFCAYEPACVDPIVANETIDFANCPTTVDVSFEVTTMGTGLELVVTNDAGGTNPANITAPGTYTVSTIAAGSNVTITLTDLNDGTCALDLGPYNAACPPGNDDCVNATTLVCNAGLISGTTVYSSTETNPIGCSSDFGVWYTFTGDGSYVTINSPSTFDHEIDLFTASAGCGSTYTQIVCDDQSTGTEEYTFESVNGTDYYLYIAHYNPGSTTTGSFDIEITCVACPIPSSLTESSLTINSVELGWTENGTATTWDIDYGTPGFTPGTGAGTMITGTTTNPHALSGLTAGTDYEWYVRSDCGGSLSDWSTVGSFTTLPPPPANDECANATVLVCNAGLISGSTVSTVAETDPVGCSNDYGVWYTFTGDGSEVTINSPSTFDHEIDLFTASAGCGSTYTQIVCKDSSTGTETYTFTTTNGTIYYIYIAHYSTSGSTTGDFDIEITCPPANNDCAGALMIGAAGESGNSGPQDFTGSTDSGVGMPMCGGSTGTDMWFSVTTDADGGELEVQVTPGPNSDVVVVLYSSTCGSLSEESCTDNPTNGAVETLTFTDPAFAPGLKTSNSRANTTYMIRVIEKSASGETFTVGTGGTALPVEFSSISAESIGAANIVKWSTSSEINNEFMILERSSDGISGWTEIGRLPGHDYSASFQSYELLDESPLSESYYRIQALDRDGRKGYSSKVHVDRRSQDTRKGLLNVYPIPSSENVIFNINTISTEEAIIRITDLSGKQVMVFHKTFAAGLQDVELNISSLADGIYFTSIISDSVIETVRIVKQ